MASTNGTEGEAAKVDIVEIETAGEVTMQPVLKHIDKKYTEQGKVYYVETIIKTIPDQVDWSSKFALCVVREFDSDNDFTGRVYVEVRRMKKIEVQLHVC